MIDNYTMLMSIQRGLLLLHSLGTVIKNIFWLQADNV